VGEQAQWHIIVWHSLAYIGKTKSSNLDHCGVFGQCVGVFAGIGGR